MTCGRVILKHCSNLTQAVVPILPAVWGNSQFSVPESVSPGLRRNFNNLVCLLKTNKQKHNTHSERPFPWMLRDSSRGGPTCRRAPSEPEYLVVWKPYQQHKHCNKKRMTWQRGRQWSLEGVCVILRSVLSLPASLGSLGLLCFSQICKRWASLGEELWQRHENELLVEISETVVGLAER